MALTNFQQAPAQEATVEMKGGLVIQAFRRDPSKFFADIPKWAEGLNLGKIEHMAITEGPSGHINLIVAYRPRMDPFEDKSLTLLNDTITLVCDLAEIVKELHSRINPPVTLPHSSQEGVGASE